MSAIRIFKSLTRLAHQTTTGAAPRYFSVRTAAMASQPSAASQVISDTARAEGGTNKGSTSAQMQSEATKIKVRAHPPLLCNSTNPC